ncbi:beta-lactamase [Steroidobacter denitrificans]|uniref:Beta-lactamase n=1 Tax=Steroidobacter denitrificans TaxID=465721 RepID=A0A127F618_STEDE|nr:MBL fold metallo-hydrolase [Steroidobacter denitrificans]AMN45886.1 beta-lactamase [Steroidobacter denitrificans]
MNVFFERIDHGITVIDTGFVRPRFDASYLLVENGRAAFVDTGPNSAVPRLLAALQRHGLTPPDVDYVIPTHVHLDHAGGVGLLMQQLPRAQLVIHPRGVRHMTDPAALMEGVRAVYGAEVAARDYGELVPVPADRVVATEDGMVVELGGRALRFAHTPGHARHHHCIWDEVSAGWFTGDAFGLAYPELHTPAGPYVVPATAPVQFDQIALHTSVERLLAEQPSRMYLTHYGEVRDPQKLARQLLRQVDAMADAARALAQAGLRGRGPAHRHEQLKRVFKDIYFTELRSMGCSLDEATLQDVLGMDIELNAQGLGVWLDKAA